MAKVTKKMGLKESLLIMLEQTNVKLNRAIEKKDQWEIDLYNESLTIINDQLVGL